MEIISRGGKKDNRLRQVQYTAYQIDVLRRKIKQEKHVWGGGNSYNFRLTKENFTEGVLSKELKDED